MTHDEELIERVKLAMIVHNPNDDMARRAIAAVRAYDAERRASVLDVDALKTFDPKTPGTLVWLPDGLTDIAGRQTRLRDATTPTTTETCRCQWRGR